MPGSQLTSYARNKREFPMTAQGSFALSTEHLEIETRATTRSHFASFTFFALVDALTRLSAILKDAGDRAEPYERAGRSLA